ncbi:MAG: hypothetical protein Q8J68_01885 [Methanolobus sp.]|uniref:hypothetical protein n=1 Tax=Methanolobus sp. TaxID=1874737 RepID=UPI00272FD621|nr:hypothetical protein [Methanolobus sp.]MDP2216026.1 hypothetical protein [Methanolobus sp.]
MEIQQININEFRPFVNDPKAHPGNQMSMLKQSLREFGWTNPILITSDKMVVAGHTRHQAAPEPGLFGGFGTTQIELHDRVCCGVELDPRYCDVTVQRYVNLNGDCKLKINSEVYTWERRRAA